MEFLKSSNVIAHSWNMTLLVPHTTGRTINSWQIIQIYLLSLFEIMYEVNTEDSNICHKTHASTIKCAQFLFLLHTYKSLRINIFKQMPRLLWNNEDGIKTIILFSILFFKCVNTEIESDIFPVFWKTSGFFLSIQYLTRRINTSTKSTECLIWNRSI